jgi:tetratricopeptide (TPR) repeat protein
MGRSPLPECDIEMGSYVVELSGPDSSYAPVRYPMLIERNEAREVRIRLLQRHDIPGGMVYVPGGEFFSGDPAAGPLKKVHVEGFLIDKTEVTGAEYEKFVKDTGAPPPDSWKGSTTCPLEQRRSAVHNVSWFEAMAYARWAGKRLPTGLEWEKAARGVDGRRYPWGNRFERRRCTWRETPVEEERLMVGRWPAGASPYGCLDMAGNVWEWTADREKPHSAQRVIRGGAVPETEDELVTYRIRGAPPGGSGMGGLNFLGFRCARSLDAETSRDSRYPLDILEFRSDLEQATEFYARIPQPDKVAICVERLLTLNPQSAAGHFWKGVHQARSGKPEPALEALKFAYLRAPDEKVQTWIDRVVADLRKAGKKPDVGFLAAGELFARAETAMSKRRFPDAEKALAAILTLDPENPQAREMMGDIAVETGRPDQAPAHYACRREDFRRTLREEPGDREGHYQFARFVLKTHTGLEEGLAAADKALALNPDDPRFHSIRAELLFALKRFGEAVEAGNQAVLLAPTRPEFKDLLKKYKSGVNQHQPGSTPAQPPERR